MSRKKLTLSDQEARAKAQRLLTQGKVTPRDVLNLESAHRQSRRKDAKYEKRHVHVGADPTLSDRGQSTTQEPTTKDEKHAAADTTRDGTTQTKTHAALEGSAGKVRAAQSAVLTRTEGGSAALSFGDGRGASNLQDAENVASSAVESRGGLGQSGTGPRFRQTERAAQGRLSRAEGRRARVETLAWVEFERDRPADAEAIEDVWGRATQDALLLRGSQPTEAFAVALASYIKWKRRGVSGRAALRAELATVWRGWADYRNSWDRGHPTLPALPWSSIKHASSVEAAGRWATQPERMRKRRDV